MHKVKITQRINCDELFAARPPATASSEATHNWAALCEPNGQLSARERARKVAGRRTCTQYMAGHSQVITNRMQRFERIPNRNCGHLLVLHGWTLVVVDSMSICLCCKTGFGRSAALYMGRRRSRRERAGAPSAEREQLLLAHGLPALPPQLAEGVDGGHVEERPAGEEEAEAHVGR